MKNEVAQSEKVIIPQVEKLLHEYYKLSAEERYEGTSKLFLDNPSTRFGKHGDMELVICKGMRCSSYTEENIVITKPLPDLLNNPELWNRIEVFNFKVSESVSSTLYGFGYISIKIRDLSNKERRRRTAENITTFLNCFTLENFIPNELMKGTKWKRQNPQLKEMKNTSKN